jgi:hypothetical protein
MDFDRLATFFSQPDESCITTIHAIADFLAVLRRPLTRQIVLIPIDWLLLSLIKSKTFQGEYRWLLWDSWKF